ncbi:MAG: alkane 1-monooxygenase [Chitinophagaceae bacterium]|nr:alkane 1-monooxygenase [Chitinophagaceae bacterium]
MTPWKFLQLLAIPLAVVAGIYLGGWYNYILPAICFVIRPLYSLTVRQREAETAAEHPAGYSSSLYRYVALLFVPVLITVTALSVYSISHTPFDLVTFIGLGLSAGIMNGIIGFTLAHEFIHRFGTADRLAGHLLLLQNNYLHYSIEHIGGHHVYACTQKDPHTARLNESFYSFLPRAIAFTFINACEIESRRLKKNHRTFLSLHNKIFWFIFLQVFVAYVLVVLAGWLAFLFLLLQSIVAITLLHITNYLQHYGLTRKEVKEGQYEKVNTHHAWNSPGRKDTLSLFQLENHADHHMHPNRPYEELLKHEESPVLPAGYSGMILLAMIPPVWFRIMNKRISSFTTKTV